jgi:outer membrane protein, heavy metal efflux system
MISSQARASLACTLLWTCARMAGAQEAPELTLADALRAALARNPQLAASGYAVTAAQARVKQARLAPATEVSLELENFAGSGDARGADALESTLALSRAVELGGQRALRTGVATAAVDLADQDRQARQLDVLADVTRRFIDTAAAQARLESARESLGLASESLADITRRVTAARSPVAERSRARIQATRAEIERAQAESALRAARYQLAATFGDAEPQFATVNADLFAFDAPITLAAYVARLDRNPGLLRLASETRLRDAELRLAQAQSRPSLNVTVGVRRFEESGDSALVAGVSLPLGGARRNAAAVAEARALRDGSEAERAAATVNARATLVALYEEMSAARLRARTLRDDALPLAREALDQTSRGYERGRFSFLELASAQQELLELQLAAIDAAADHHRLRTELERLTGAPTP